MNISRAAAVVAMIVMACIPMSSQPELQSFAPEVRGSYIRLLQGNYWGLITGQAQIELTCKNQERIREDFETAFQSYASDDDLGFTEDDFENAMTAFVQRFCTTRESRAHTVWPSFHFHL